MQTLAQKVQRRDELLPRIQELETFFEHYPDHPKEAIIKEDLLRLGVRFSEAALKANEGYQLRSYFLFSFDTVEAWCIEPNSPLGGHPFIPLDYYVRIDKCWYETWEKYHLPPVRGCGSMGAGRAVYSPSAFMDMGS